MMSSSEEWKHKYQELKQRRILKKGPSERGSKRGQVSTIVPPGPDWSSTTPRHLEQPTIIEADPEAFTRFVRRRTKAVFEKSDSPKSREYSNSLQVQSEREDTRQTYSSSIDVVPTAQRNRLYSDHDKTSVQTADRLQRKANSILDGESWPALERKRSASMEQINKNDIALDKLEKRAEERNKDLDLIERQLSELTKTIEEGIETANVQLHLLEDGKLERCRTLCAKIERLSGALGPLQAELSKGFVPDVIDKGIDGLMIKLNSHRQVTERDFGRVVEERQKQIHHDSFFVVPGWLRSFVESVMGKEHRHDTTKPIRNDSPHYDGKEAYESDDSEVADRVPQTEKKMAKPKKSLGFLLERVPFTTSGLFVFVWILFKLSVLLSLLSFLFAIFYL